MARRGDETAYLQVSMQISSLESYEREFGDLERIKDNYPKYVILSDPMATLVNDDGIQVLKTEDYLL
ncbi:MAG: hypothetical protein IJR26_00570 [Bacteroidales bacterium]|nr:hypothetical protein [Bacteroidales bacterium]